MVSTLYPNPRGQGALNRVWGASTASTVRLGKILLNKRCGEGPFQWGQIIFLGCYLSVAPLRCSTLGQAPGLTHKHQTRLEKLDRHKHSSLFKKSVNQGQKSFIKLPTGLKLFAVLIYCYFKVIMSFCVIKSYYLGNYCGMAVKSHRICVTTAIKHNLT